MLLFDEISSPLYPELIDEVPNLIGHLAVDGMTMILATPPDECFSRHQKWGTQSFLTREVEAGG